MTARVDRKKHRAQKRHDQEKRREEKLEEASPLPPTAPPPVQPSTPISQLTTPPAPSPEGSSRWKRLSTVWTGLGGVGLLGLIVAIVGILYTHQQAEINSKQLKELQRQNDLSERNQKRLTGEITAKMQLAWSSPEREQFPDDMKIKAFGLLDVPYFKNLQSFLFLPPTVRLNNVGDESIEAIRLVTSCTEVDLDKGIEPKSTIQLRSEEQEEIALPQLWLPGKAIEVSLVRNLVAQIAQVQMRQPQDVLHRAFFETRIYGKIAGSNVYGNSENKMVMTWVVWLPSGFPDNKCREVYDRLRQKISFGPKQPVTMLTGTDLVDVAKQIKAKNEGRPK